MIYVYGRGRTRMVAKENSGTAFLVGLGRSEMGGADRLEAVFGGGFIFGGRVGDGVGRGGGAEG